MMTITGHLNLFLAYKSWSTATSRHWIILIYH